jgi:hypothetical protein
MQKIKIDPIVTLGYSIIIILCLIPAFIQLPFRPNIYLAWEGAYRISQGEIPFRDFGMPFGVGFWIIPSLFFKLFGPYFKVLVLAQSLVNVATIFVVKGILKKFQLNDYLVFILIIVLYSSMIMPTYWPWYNQMAVFYQLLGILFLTKSLFDPAPKWNNINILLCALFSTIALFTKQDIGFFALFINLSVLSIFSILQKKWKLLIVFLVSTVVFIAMNILPFIQYEFSYWFNYGQYPHHARLTLKDLAYEFITGSKWIKFYLLIIFVLLIQNTFFIKSPRVKTTQILFVTLTLLILGEAVVIQYTSFNPDYLNTFFHVFALAFILSNVDLKIDLTKKTVFIPIVLLTLTWWSFYYWKYANKVLDLLTPSTSKNIKKEFVLSKYTWRVNTDTIKNLPYKLYPSDFEVLKGVTIPKETNAAIHQIKNLPIVEQKGGDLNVLNMSELTFLPYEFGYHTIKGKNIPLWHHYNVSFFEREKELYCDKVKNEVFDLILFQDVNYSRDYFPGPVKECIENFYKKEFTFRGPKGLSGNYIHVYTRR